MNGMKPMSKDLAATREIEAPAFTVLIIRIVHSRSVFPALCDS